MKGFKQLGLLTRLLRKLSFDDGRQEIHSRTGAMPRGVADARREVALEARHLRDEIIAGFPTGNRQCRAIDQFVMGIR